MNILYIFKNKHTGTVRGQVFNLFEIESGILFYNKESGITPESPIKFLKSTGMYDANDKEIFDQDLFCVEVHGKSKIVKYCRPVYFDKTEGDWFIDQDPLRSYLRKGRLQIAKVGNALLNPNLVGQQYIISRQLPELV